MYTSIAQQRWPAAIVHGEGRFAVFADVTPVMDVYLSDSEEQARSVGLYYDRYVIVDLKPAPVCNIPDDYETRQWQRRLTK
jgi:hypothetical protein